MPLRTDKIFQVRLRFPLVRAGDFFEPEQDSSHCNFRLANLSGVRNFVLNSYINNLMEISFLGLKQVKLPLMGRSFRLTADQKNPLTLTPGSTFRRKKCLSDPNWTF